MLYSSAIAKNWTRLGAQNFDKLNFLLPHICLQTDAIRLFPRYAMLSMFRQWNLAQDHSVIILYAIIDCVSLGIPK